MSSRGLFLVLSFSDSCRKVGRGISSTLLSSIEGRVFVVRIIDQMLKFEARVEDVIHAGKAEILSQVLTFLSRQGKRTDVILHVVKKMAYLGELSFLHPPR